ncbi:hypothetical protein HIM_05631 [Hirsutella minnesotensis 3608]|uniref:HAT C-terminal dimerisation domain-containing protein n=1 Tax=Hirsutella minnesotensis 3608 TaxID=1043627 RepID=A0A0F7ZP53_9HYPO|nr:hypothetical protein HIM_05631 [Hirsutella minnesotensis 3608]
MSVDPERTFSVTKLTLTSQRQSLSPEVTEEIQCLRNWLIHGAINVGEVVSLGNEMKDFDEEGASLDDPDAYAIHEVIDIKEMDKYRKFGPFGKLSRNWPYIRQASTAIKERSALGTRATPHFYLELASSQHLKVVLEGDEVKPRSNSETAKTTLSRVLEVLGRMGGEIEELKNRVSEQSDTIRKLSATVYKQSTIIQGQEDLIRNLDSLDSYDT